MVWFKHDTHASIDSKLQELMLDYGAAGYGLYWYCIELIAQRVDKDNVTFELEHDARIIARNLNLTVIETTNMMKKMVELNLFSFTENNKLACYALAKRLDQSMTSNPSMRKLISNIKHNHDGVMTESIESHDLVNSEEKRREEKRKDKYDIGVFSEEEFKQIKAYRSKLNKSIKTQLAVTKLSNSFKKCYDKGFSFDKVFTIMQENQWQSINVEWIKDEAVPQNKVRRLG